MQKLVIAETKSSPGVELDGDNNIFRIYGSSYVSDAHEFFTPIIEWVDKYTESLAEKKDIIFQLSFQYINSTSSRFVLVLLRRMLEAGHDKINLTIEWIYEAENEDTFDAGKDLEFVLNVPFIFKST